MAQQQDTDTKANGDVETNPSYHSKDADSSTPSSKNNSKKRKATTVAYSGEDSGMDEDVESQADALDCSDAEEESDDFIEFIKQDGKCYRVQRAVRTEAEMKEEENKKEVAIVGDKRYKVVHDRRRIRMATVIRRAVCRQ